MNLPASLVVTVIVTWLVALWALWLADKRRYPYVLVILWVVLCCSVALAMTLAPW